MISTLNSKLSRKKIAAALLLLEKGLCSSREQAEAYIYAGQVLADDQRVEKPGQLLKPDAVLRLKTKTFVGRGGDKLAQAIEDLGLSEAFRNTVVLDIGASTGGFTDCVLQLGAQKVLAVEVGFNQLSWKLRQDPRVLCFENTDIANFDASPFPELDWILADLSFRSLESMAPSIMRVSGSRTQFLILVKPQFELPKHEVPEGGVVRDEELWNKAIAQAQAAFEKLGVTAIRVIRSALPGRSGNQEFFLYFGK